MGAAGFDIFCRKYIFPLSPEKIVPTGKCRSIFAELLANRSHFLDDVIYIQNHFHHAHLLIINGGVKFALDLRLTDMIYLESQRDSCQRTGIGGVTIGDCLSGEAGSFSFSCPQENDDVLRAILFGKLLDPLLIFQIHCTSGRSDEALSRGKYNFCSGALRTGLDSLAGNAVPITDNDHFLVF